MARSVGASITFHGSGASAGFPQAASVRVNINAAGITNRVKVFRDMNDISCFPYPISCPRYPIPESYSLAGTPMRPQSAICGSAMGSFGTG